MWIERTLRDWVLFFLLIAVWGSAFSMMKLAVASIPPFTVVAIRMILGLAILYPTMRLMGQKLPSIFFREESQQSSGLVCWLYLTVVSLTGSILPSSLLMWGQVGIDTSLASIFISFAPITTLIMAHIFLPEEKMTIPKITGFVLAFIGIGILMGPSAVGSIGSEDTFVYQFAVFCAAIIYGSNHVIAKRMPTLHPLAAGTGMVLIATLIMTPIALIVDQPWNLEPTNLSLFMAFLLGVFPTGLAYVIFFTLINSAGPTFVALSSYLVPIWAMMVGVFFLGERPGLNLLAALILILAGSGLSQLRSKTLVEKRSL
jgi:drug/metabolite transporter (DMT)-like permease